MNNSEMKVAHLNMIQGIINRMANNSFLLKGWSITVISALFALATQNKENNFLYLSLLPCLMFWYLDAYFLRQERLYRQLYQYIASKTENKIDFSMNTKPFENNIDCLCKTCFSNTLLVFYGTIFVVIICLRYFI